MSSTYLETLNIEWGKTDPKDNRRVKFLTCFIFIKTNKAVSPLTDRLGIKKLPQAIDSNNPQIYTYICINRDSSWTIMRLIAY